MGNKSSSNKYLVQPDPLPQAEKKRCTNRTKLVKIDAIEQRAVDAFTRCRPFIELYGQYKDHSKGILYTVLEENTCLSFVEILYLVNYLLPMGLTEIQRKNTSSGGKISYIEATDEYFQNGRLMLIDVAANIWAVVEANQQIIIQEYKAAMRKINNAMQQ
jgi:hypothetical protein